MGIIVIIIVELSAASISITSSVSVVSNISMVRIDYNIIG